MKLVIDTNRIIAALIRNGTSRALITNSMFKFYSPDKVQEEITQHNQEAREKSHLTEEQFKSVLKLLFEHIEVHPQEKYQSQLKEAESLIEDSADVPFIALSLALENIPIWSDDAHFQHQKRIKVFTTSELFKIASEEQK